MVNISNRRGSSGANPPQRYRLLRCTFLLAASIIVGIHILTLRSVINLHSISDHESNHIASAETPTNPLPPKKYNDELSLRYEKEPVVIAHAISLIKCSKGPSVAGFLDAAAVLRHSIHKNSVHHKALDASLDGDASSKSKTSRYSYQMYAIVHPSCEQHAKVLERLGYKIMVRDHPVKKEDIKGEWLRNHIESENCCGSAEFIKLYAYHLTDHPIAVHWDMDVAILQPLDEMYDIMIYPPEHVRNIEARESIERQHPEEKWPETVDAFLTRDITSAKPWEKVTAVQGGFLVARPDKAVFDAYIDFIKEGDYKGGRGDGTGWGGLGYGGFQGAMAYQGVVAYYYDQLRPNTAVELNVCRWNQVAADVIWRGPEREEEHHLQCREHPRSFLDNGEPDYKSNTNCEDCRSTPIEEIKTAHYTACKKPWECTMAYPRVPRDKRQSHRLENLVNVDYCMNLVREWFELRKQFEDALEIASDGQVTPSKRDGAYKDEYFMGYCNRSGGYITIEPPPDDFDIKKIYGM